MEGKGFVDIHCHILPGLDDGPKDWDESVAMAKVAEAEGVTHLVATPHQLGAYINNSASRIRELVDEFRRRLEAAGIGLEVYAGADVRVEPELAAKLRRGEVLALGPQGRYVLVEPPFDVPIPLGPVQQAVQAAGFCPILTHPERTVGMGHFVDQVRRWVDRGGAVQITGGSLLGSFGVEVQSRAERLLREGLVHVVASDAHGAWRRRPVWRRVYSRLCELVGSEVADLLCRDNPRRILAGEEVLAPEVPAGCLTRILRWMYRRAS